jgi:phosphate transport system substrate-binding protein
MMVQQMMDQQHCTSLQDGVPKPRCIQKLQPIQTMLLRVFVESACKAFALPADRKKDCSRKHWRVCVEVVLRRMIRLFQIAAILCSCLSSCAPAQAQDQTQNQAQKQVQNQAQNKEISVIVGAGSNLPIHLYQTWMSRFNASNHHIQVQYLPLGSSESIRLISAGIGDFGAGEIPLTEEQMHNSRISLLPIPTTLVGIVPVYNLPGKPELNFSGGVLARIYLGTIRNWNDPQIVKLNPGVVLPDLPIRVVHRSPGKGSNFIFTDFLSKTDLEFRVEVGRSPSPHWPLGVEANRGQDMVEMVASIEGAIGYVELSFVRNSHVSYGRVENASGRFVAATMASLEAACAAVEISRPDDFRLTMTNAPGKDAYPITSFTWIYLPTSGVPLASRRAVKQFLLWSLQDGQKVAATLGYATLPDRIAAKALAVVISLP